MRSNESKLAPLVGDFKLRVEDSGYLSFLTETKSETQPKETLKPRQKPKLQEEEKKASEHTDQSNFKQYFKEFVPLDTTKPLKHTYTV